jgi:catalase
MPLPTDEQLLKLANDLISTLDHKFGVHPGFRPAHARGLLVKGVFTPTAAAPRLSKAPHFGRASTPVTVRFSSGTGLPLISDVDPKANPRGMATRFHLEERVHTDIIGQSANGFPVRTGSEFLEFLRVAGIPEELEKFVAAHPAAKRFLEMPKPNPLSFATEAFFGVSAMEFENVQGVKRFGRFRLVPEAGVKHLSAEELAGKGESYLFDELRGRMLAGAPGFRIQVQLADVGDVVDDATVQWPETRELMEVGRMTLTEFHSEDAEAQKHIIFDPIPRVVGIEPSADPLLELRAAIYLLSGQRRRSA